MPKSKNLHRAIFLDRDGTINVNTDYVNSPDDVKLLPNAVEGLRILQKSGFLLVIITNQSGIARGYFTENNLYQINARLIKLLRAEGIIITDLLYCPYHINGTIPRYTKNSLMRKPLPGMILKASKQHKINPLTSFMIGDTWSDIGAGINAKCLATILIKNNRNKGKSKPEADVTVSDLLEAAVWISRKEQEKKIISSETAAKAAKEYKKKKQLIIFTNGVFDLLHPGHVEFLKLSRKMGDVLFVGLNSDSSVKSFKGPNRPINKEAIRAEMLSALDFVDHIVIFPDRTPKKLINLIKPSIQVKDASYKKEELLEYKTVVKNGGKVVQIPRIGDYSTTNIIQGMKK